MELKVVDTKTAKLAKEVGFDWETQERYDLNMGHYEDSDAYANYNSWYNYASAPAQELLRQFIRENYNLHLETVGEKLGQWFWTLYDLELEEVIVAGQNTHEKYEQALEAGLKEALKYLLNQKE